MSKSLDSVLSNINNDTCNMGIQSLNMPKRFSKILRGAGIHRVHELRVCSETKIIALERFGKQGMAKLKAALLEASEQDGPVSPEVKAIRVQAEWAEQCRKISSVLNDIPGYPNLGTNVNDLRDAIRHSVGLRHALADLPYRERSVVELRFGLADGHPYTLDETGKIFGITRERVRQIEARALRKLQEPSKMQHVLCLPQKLPDPEIPFKKQRGQTTSIEDSQLSTRAKNVLRNMNVDCIEQLRQLNGLPRQQFLDMFRHQRNCGETTVAEIQKFIRKQRREKV